MARLSLYLDEGTAERLLLAAHEAGVSRSTWVAHLIATRLASSWPAEFQALAGAWSDFPSLSEIREEQELGAGKEQCAT